MYVEPLERDACLLERVRRASGLLALAALAPPARRLGRVAPVRSDSCTALAELVSAGILAFAPEAESAATAAKTAVVNSIRVLVMSYIPRLLLDHSTMWRA